MHGRILARPCAVLLLLDGQLAGSAVVYIVLPSLVTQKDIFQHRLSHSVVSFKVKGLYIYIYIYINIYIYNI